jgi:type II secretory pathway predicted ATPase ExeA
VEHLQHFGLSEDPFRNDPRLRDFIETEPNQEALARLGRGLRQQRALLVLTGELGSGKTMVVRRLLDSLEEEVFEASMLVVLNGSADTAWMLTRFAKQLGVEEPQEEREALLAQVYERLAMIREDGRHAVLIIDDAHLLAGGPALAEVCGLLKLEYEERRLFSLVLAGEAPLAAALLADPTLAHRVDVRVHMRPLDPAGAVSYLGRRIRQAGSQPAILGPDAIAALHELGGGLPGRMNTLADNGLFEAFLCGRDRVSRVDVERAHRDLAWGAARATQVAAAPSAALASGLDSAEDLTSRELMLNTPVPPQRPAPLPAFAAAADPGTSIDASLFASPGERSLGAAVGAEDDVPELEILDGDDASLSGLDSDLEAVFEEAKPSPHKGRAPAPRAALEAPPKDEDPEELVAELLDD